MTAARGVRRTTMVRSWLFLGIGCAPARGISARTRARERTARYMRVLYRGLAVSRNVELLPHVLHPRAADHDFAQNRVCQRQPRFIAALDDAEQHVRLATEGRKQQHPDALTLGRFRDRRRTEETAAHPGPRQRPFAEAPLQDD